MLSLWLIKYQIEHNYKRIKRRRIQLMAYEYSDAAEGIKDLVERLEFLELESSTQDTHIKMKDQIAILENRLEYKELDVGIFKSRINRRDIEAERLRDVIASQDIRVDFLEEENRLLRSEKNG